jgi:hypothetical protein
VLGVLGQRQRSSELDASGLARLLTSQKDSILAALPSGFSKYLGETGILDAVTAQKYQPAYAEPSGSIPWRWPLGALALIVLAVLGWRLLSGPHREAVETTAPTLEVPLADSLAKLRGIKSPCFSMSLAREIRPI